MRRVAAIVLVGLAGLILAAAGPATDEKDGTYEVRAIFDNAAFLVKGEDVRIAGARVGSVADLTVSRPGEIVSLEHGGRAIPGKAVVVLEIDDPAFQDFRTDASCLIRPQSLLGEKFVECQPTQPRASGTPAPPPIASIPDGEAGAGEYLLPLENNGRTVDLDLVQDIQRLPYAERFRLILNELGAGLSARGPELEAIVERANPALRQTDRVLAILAEQNRVLAQLARDGDAILAPLARERAQVAGFIDNAGQTAAASAPQSAEISAGLELLPAALRELRATMPQLQAFTDAAGPVLGTLGDAGPSLTRATAALGPFSRQATGALTSLGLAAELSGPDIAAADPVLVALSKLASETRPAALGLRDLLRSLSETGGYERLMDFLFYSVGATNGFDQYGHFLRALLIITNCNDYEIKPIGGCEASFTGGVGQ